MARSQCSDRGRVAWHIGHLRASAQGTCTAGTAPLGIPGPSLCIRIYTIRHCSNRTYSRTVIPARIRTCPCFSVWRLLTLSSQPHWRRFTQRMTGLRGALGLRTCWRTLTAAAVEPWGARAASLVPLGDSAPSTSYAAPECTSGWQRWWRRGSGSSSGGHAVSSTGAARWQHSDAARAASAPRQVLYQVVVVTGDVRGAGSPAPAVVTLVGSGGHSLPCIKYLAELSWYLVANWCSDEPDDS